MFFGGVLMWVITGLIPAWFWAGLAPRPDDLDAGAAQTLFDIAQYWVRSSTRRP
ncbi:MAG: hypothetical protein HRT86_08790 [Ilumatobacteraceae bacterium]|nr:hypothetical protein [Ilumatobacteraceae bacterium]